MKELINKVECLKEDDRSPDGFYLVEGIQVFYNPSTNKIIVLGCPEQFDYDIEQDEKGNISFKDEKPLEGDLRNHCCDLMGCGTLDHVIMKGTINETGF